MQNAVVHFPILQMLNTGANGSRFKPYSFAELAAQPAASWLVDDVLPDSSLATIYGRPSEGKTFAALDMALCVATGRAWHGHPTKQRQVVYVASEGFSGIRTRVEAWQQYHGLQAGKFFVVKEAVQLLDTSEVGELIQAIQAKPLEPGLLVIDTFARSFAGDENSAQEVGAAISALAQIQNALRCTVMVVHHSGKARGVRATERGSSALRGAMDVMIHVVKSGNVVQVISDKQKDAEDFATLSLTLHIESLGADAVGKARSSCVLIHPAASGPATGGLTASQQAALRALTSLPAGPVASKTWCQASLADMSPRTFYAAAKGLLKEGYVSQPRTGGPYELTAEGTATAKALQGAAIVTGAATAATTPTPVGCGEVQQALQNPDQEAGHGH